MKVTNDDGSGKERRDQVTECWPPGNALGRAFVEHKLIFTCEKRIIKLQSIVNLVIL